MQLNMEFLLSFSLLKMLVYVNVANYIESELSLNESVEVRIHLIEYINNVRSIHTYS
jgi:hypothetical protein